MSTKKPPNRTIQRVSQRAIKEDAKLRDQVSKGVDITKDSFVNFAQKLGVGADNPLTSAGYGFNPITRVRTMLEWIYRGSWFGGVVVDVIANDMTRAGINIKGNLPPEDIELLNEASVTLGIWNKINETIKWARLYGGCLAVMLIDGQDLSTPLRLETIGKGQLKGLLVLDRWMVEPSLHNLVTDAGPELGLPKFYYVTANAPALPRATIHHSRCIRLVGIELPYWQRVMENLWGISVLERLNDRMIAFDSATTGAAQLVYKAYLRTYKIKGMRQVVAAGGDALNGLIQQVDMMRRFQGIEGMTLLDGEDEMEAMQSPSFTGISDALTQFAQQLSGASQIPLMRLFGQSPSGFNSGDNEVRLYYDQILQDQNKDLKVPVTKLYRALAQSEGIKLPEGFSIQFRSLWQLDEKTKADIAGAVIDTVTKAQEAGLISDKVAMQELRQASDITGIFSNIPDEDIEAADAVAAPPEASEVLGEQGIKGKEDKPNPKEE